MTARKRTAPKFFELHIELEHIQPPKKLGDVAGSCTLRWITGQWWLSDRLNP